MASTAFRKVTPSLCVAGSSENRPASRSTYLPRTSSKNLTNITNQTGKNNSVSSIRSGRARFADNTPLPVCVADLRLKVVTPLEDSKAPFEHLPSPLTTRLGHLNTPGTPPISPDEIAPEHIPLPATPAPEMKQTKAALPVSPLPDSAPAATDTIAERIASPIDPLSDCAPIASESRRRSTGSDKTNPFRDAGTDTTIDDSTISRSSSNLDIEQTTFSSIVRVVNSDADTISFTNDELMHDKELEAYAISLEQLYNPDIAKRQYRERAGSLYIMAIAMMKEKSLSPLDLTEDEFVHLVLSQGNGISQFLALPQRILAQRMINRRKATQLQLANLGLPSSRLNEDFLDFYCSLTEREQLRFKEACKRIVAFVVFAQKTAEVNDLTLEKLKGLAVFERAPYYTSIDSDSLALASVKADILVIEEVLNMLSDGASSSGYSCTDIAYDGAHDGQGAPPEITKIFNQIFKDREVDKKPSNLSPLRPKRSLTKLLTRLSTEFQSPVADVGLLDSTVDVDAGIETTGTRAAAGSFTNLLFDSVSLSRLSRFKFFVKQSLKHPFHHREVTKDTMKLEVDCGAEGDSDTSANSKLRTHSNDATDPTLEHIVSPISCEQQTPRKSQDRRLSVDSGIALGLEVLPIIARSNRTVRLKRSSVEEIQKANGFQIDIRSIDDVFVEIPERQLENAQNMARQVQPTLERSTSCFSLRRRNAMKNGVESDIAAATIPDEHGNRTLKRKLSGAFRSRKQSNQPGARRVTGSDFKVFGRSGLHWDSTKWR